MKRIAQLVVRTFLYCWMPVVLLVMWWVFPRPSSLYFPPFWVIVDTFKKEWLSQQAGVDIPPSMEHLAAGFALAVVGGIAIALVLCTSRPLYDASLPVITFFRGLPSPALIPPLLLIFGLGAGFKVAIIAFGALWPVLLNAHDGFRSINAVQADTARCYGLTPLQRIFKVMIPAASPQIVAGARTALQVSILLMVASEFLASTSGIGYALYIAQLSFDTPGIWADMVLIGLIGVALNVLFLLAEKWVLGWYFGMRVREARG